MMKNDGKIRGSHSYTKSDIKLSHVAIDIRSHRILNKLLNEVPRLKMILSTSQSPEEAIEMIRGWVMNYFESNPIAYQYYKKEIRGRDHLTKLDWQDYAAIRIMDYIDFTGVKFTDPNIKINRTSLNNPFRLLWLAANQGVGGAKYDFFEDMYHLFLQFTGEKKKMTKPLAEEVQEWMDRHPSGLDPEMLHERKQNRDHIIEVIIRKIDEGYYHDPKFFFKPGLTHEQKVKQVNRWWNNHLFHLRFAIREPELLNEFLNYSLSYERMELLKEGRRAGIPLFINPYYLSLLNTRILGYAAEADRTIRDYVLMNKPLIREFGKIVAWELEDRVEPGKPNAAGWILPTHHNIHRRYPEVAILIPDTVGRACGGLCVSCQRMYDFQAGHLNFNLEKMKPKMTWPEKLRSLMHYFEEDAQLRDILITGGDALMSSDNSLRKLLDEVYEMAYRKKEANKLRKEGEKLAEMVRVRLGTRLLAYLPMRVTDGLIEVLKEFKEKAVKIGIRQFVIQTHIESAMEVTEETVKAVKKILQAGWIVTNQMVFTTAGSRRGHTAKLRQVLNKIGVLPYYTFTVKGYLENSYNFAPNARSVQEQLEEKVVGQIPTAFYPQIKALP
ncbi:MAG: hypothetical protein J7L89_08375, partial [Bacteroidales bacterium]|nr:hypothetical protein [Bacteroidales bacterium]